eukprot:scpid81382/ scgid12587/ Mammalian ependymin-related protein 1
MIRWLAVLAVVVAVAAQRPEVCDSPAQWSANMVIFDPVEGHEFAMDAKYYYDKTGLRKARIEQIDPGRNTTHRYVHVIELFAEHKAYYIDLGTRDCVERSLDRPGSLDGFHPHDVPAEASFRGLFYIGSDAVSDGHVEASAWDYYYSDRGYFWHGTFTTHGCIPLRSDHFNHTTFGARFEEFFDVVPGISDPNVFVPPSNCHPEKH